MSNNESIVKEIVMDKVGIEESKITSDARFIEALGADSLDTVDLVMHFEEEFNIEISDSDAESLNTMGKVLEYLEKLK